MTDFRERYKRLGFDPEANRALRSHRRDEARRGFRDEQMSLRRDMQGADHDDSDEDTTASTQESGVSACSQDSASCKSVDSHGELKDKANADHEAAVQQRWERLQKWREEKSKRKQLEKKKAKPVFKVGVVHHRIYSPPTNKEPAPMPPPKLCKSRDISANMSQVAPPKRVTRATEKRLAVKTIVNQKKRDISRSKKKTQPRAEDATSQDEQTEIAPKDHTFKAPVGIAPMPIFGRQALEATKANIEAEISSFQLPSTLSVGVGPFRESLFDESSFSLKLSDDQEMLDESATKEARSPVSRRSLKNQSPPAADEASLKGVTPDDQEAMEVEQFSAIEKRNGSFSTAHKTESPVNKKSPVKVASAESDSASLKKGSETGKRKSVVEAAVDSPRRTRSTRPADRRRSARIVSTDSADSGIEPSLTPDEPTVNRRRSTKVTASASAIDSETESNSTPDNKGRPSSGRRKSKVAPSESVEKAPTPPQKPVNKRRSTKLIASDSTDNEEFTFAKPESSTRRSTKFTPDTEAMDTGNVDVSESPPSNVPTKSPSRKMSTRFTTNGQENLDFNSTNLMDFTFSAPANPPKLADAPKSLLDDTVTNLTPRRSSRLPSTAAPTGNCDEDQPLIRFSSFYIPPTAGNESSSSEPTKQSSPNDLMSLSLNMSLPKETEEERPPAFFSPYIVQSRGKNSERKEMKKRRFSRGVENEDIPTKDTIMQKLNISIEEEERTAQYYKLILDKEIERLNELCDRWNVVKEDPETPEEARYIIQAACGQTRLLINKKFERFRSLVQDCETGRGEMLVTCKDLQGFWEMMYMEINDCEGRFNKLEEMKANNWVAKEDEAALKEVEKKKKKKKAPVKKPAAAKKPAAGKPSSLRAMIAAARKKKVEADGSVEDGEARTTESVEKPVEEPNEAEQTTTPSRTNLRRMSTPKSASKWDNLLKKVQLSQTKKSTTSPLVMMKLSKLVKTPEVQLDDSIVYINSGRTPAKSILKKDEVMGSVSKSTHKVFFQEQSNEVKEFRNSFVDDSVGLDNIEEAKEPIERKLNFEDDSFVENTEDNDNPSESTPSVSQSVSKSADSPRNKKVVTLAAIPLISLSPLSLEDTSLATKAKSAKTKKQISFKQGADESQPRNLRTKKFSAPLTPIPKRRGEDVEEDMSVEISDIACEGDNDTPKQQFTKEIYLNDQGVVCERFVPVKKNTPGKSNLKRSNSETTQRSKKSIRILESDESKNTPATPRPRRRNTNVPEIHVITPRSALKESSAESKSSTSHSKGQSLKRSFAETTLTPDNVESMSIEEATTPKLSKRTPTTSKSKPELKEDSTKTPTLKRTRSLKVKNNEEVSVAQTESAKLRRTKSLSIKEGVADSPKEALKRKSLKKLQENIEPNEQETDARTKEKLPKTPSFKRKSSKSIEKLTDVSDAVSDAMTPNTRRKSLRITRASMRDAN